MPGKEPVVLYNVYEVRPVRLAEIQAARRRHDGLTIVSPAVTCHAAPAGRLVRLKLENLQPIGSFELRPVGVSGGNLDTATLTTILQGEVP